MQNQQITPEKFLKKAYKVAEVYGFMNSEHAFKEHERKKDVAAKMNRVISDPHVADIAALLRMYFEHNLHIKHVPLFIFHSNISKDTAVRNSMSSKKSDAQCTLTIIGIEDSYAEAIILSCVAHIFRKMNSTDHRVRINSIGTQANTREYLKKLSKTMKKMNRRVHPECRRLLKESKFFDAHRYLYDNDHTPVSEHIVPTLRLLSDNARIHFEQIIECLEIYDLMYELSPDLVETPHHNIHTVFEIVEQNFPLYARGGRFDPLSSYLYRRKTPVVSATIRIPKKAPARCSFAVKPQKPKVLFFHAGEKARIHSLRVLAKLCDANIPVSHRLYCKKVSDQIDDCEHLYPYTIIFGQEEVESDVLCVRKSDTRATSTVRMDKKSLSSVKKFIRS